MPHNKTTQGYVRLKVLAERRRAPKNFIQSCKPEGLVRNRDRWLPFTQALGEPILLLASTLVPGKETKIYVGLPRKEACDVSRM